MGMAFLEIENLSRQFGGLMAVNDVSFQVEPGRDQGGYRPQWGGQDHPL